MTRRSDEAETETLQVIENIIERMDFEFTAIAGTGIDFANGEAAAQPAAGQLIQACRQLGNFRISLRRRLGERGLCETFQEYSPHCR
jgi:hypothetical protein